MVFTRWLTCLERPLRFRNRARRRPRNPLPRFLPELVPLEERCLLSGSPDPHMPDPMPGCDLDPAALENLLAGVQATTA